VPYPLSVGCIVEIDNQLLVPSHHVLSMGKMPGHLFGCPLALTEWNTLHCLTQGLPIHILELVNLKVLPFHLQVCSSYRSNLACFKAPGWVFVTGGGMSDLKSDLAYTTVLFCLFCMLHWSDFSSVCCIVLNTCMGSVLLRFIGLLLFLSFLQGPKEGTPLSNLN